MSSLFKRGGSWHLQWYDATGKQRRKSTGISIEADPRGTIARQVQRDHDSRQAKQTAGIEDQRQGVASAISAWLKTLWECSAQYQRESRVRAEKWRVWLEARGIRDIDRIRADDIRAWIEDRRSQVSPKTLKEDIVLLRAVARLANQTRTVSPIPIDSWPTITRTTAQRPERVGAYSPDEIERIIEDLSKWQRRKQWVLPVMLLAYLGCRWSELAALRVADVRLDASPPMVRIESHKTAKSRRDQHRYIEVHPRIMPELAALTAGRVPSDPLLEMPDHHNARNVMFRCCQRLGIQYRRLHGLRHSWITAMLNAGAPLPIVMAQAGHRNLSTVQRYTHVPTSAEGWVQKALPGKKAASPKTSPNS